ncbi:putative 4-hydroxy-2-oxoglutarate aldolase [Colletotrichum gloeosporioides]|uniref:Putative 4-hydroxy-2-oxoglutarate aldolase n=1 Tax=Colletotrichum gloeosporioides TaxID=474922 RepID=A0A8H4FHG2_COLGL|nr:putative 4-hydroxy-2-oxoglutarate aldolase [Colletotrichum gloeosporioides]KAF3802428.1 putative 4-hydroxy-2-oxoglutarate aldolase [Colletotrichum gloeosporioides]
MAPRCPPRGIYAPVVAFFHEDETLDVEALKTHIERLSKSGVAGLVIQGSNGEAPHLLHSERQQVIATAAAVLKQHGRPDAVIIAGCGAQSTRETIQLCSEAKESGADYALVLSPSYWTGAMQKPVIQKFFDDVATASPIPILLYNFPAVTSGIDLDSDLIAALAASNDKIVGCKLTCGNLGKLHRVAHDAKIPQPFAAFAGKSDFFLHGLVAGSNGVIAAAANFVPKVHLRLLELYDAGELKQAQELQTKLSQADWVLVQLGVAGLKAALDRYFGYGGGRSRRPLGMVASAKFEGEKDAVLKGLVELETSL